ncbi:MAG: inositol monophosphatase [Dehalococcoidia bacterium]|nr:MAG: inositol monophosphatase [Dehalococcoidia bacterium]
MAKTRDQMKAFLEGLVKQAGTFLLARFKKDIRLQQKRYGVKDAITKYDKLVDELIVHQIRNQYPEHRVLSEEGGLTKGESEWLWIVDSLDGTTSFANSNPLFSVCIALQHDGELLLGAIYAPALGELYFAEKGKGAFLNHKRIHVSEISELKKSYLLYCEGGEKDRLKTGSILGKIYPEVMDLRKLGSAGLETAWVAAGKAEAYFTTNIEPWDVAPGILLIQEAGGRVTNFQGNSWKVERSDLLFSNGKVHSSLLDFLEP